MELLFPRLCSCSPPAPAPVSPHHPHIIILITGAQLWPLPCNFSISTYPPGNSFVFVLHNEFFSIWAKPLQFHISQNLMSKHLIISSNHGTKSLISIHPENCILFTAACSWPLSHLPIQFFSTFNNNFPWNAKVMFCLKPNRLTLLHSSCLKNQLISSISLPKPAWKNKIHLYQFPFASHSLSGSPRKSSKFPQNWPSQNQQLFLSTDVFTTHPSCWPMLWLLWNPSTTNAVHQLCAWLPGSFSAGTWSPTCTTWTPWKAGTKLFFLSPDSKNKWCYMLGEVWMCYMYHKYQ